MAGGITISKAACRALLCLALVAALLSQNFRHVKAEALVPGTAVAMLNSDVVADGSATGSDVSMVWPKADCCDHCGQPIGLLRVAFDFTPMRPTHATATPECGFGASPPHPDEPPRA